jgi:hypothetical protein
MREYQEVCTKHTAMVHTGRIEEEEPTTNETSGVLPVSLAL